MRKMTPYMCASVIAITMAMATGAEAQTTTNDAATSEVAPQVNEIVVTAQKRSENVQDVPLAVTAVSTKALQALGVTEVAAIGGQAPNVTLRSTTSFGGSSSILVSYIRGIGQNDFAFNVEPGVGIYVDGVYLARNIGANVDLLDLERIEVLKGPQGTLFGRNTMGGALNIVTRDPGDSFTYAAEGTIGRFNRRDFRGAMDLPIKPGLLQASVALSTKHRDGYQRRIAYTGNTGNNPIYLAGSGGAFGGPPNTNTNEANRFYVTGSETPDRSGNQKQTAIRGKLLWTPNEQLTGRLIADYLTTDEQAAPFSLIRVEQNAYVAIYNTCITGNPAVISAVTAQTGFAGIPQLCNGARGNVRSPTGVSPSLASEAGRHLPYDGRYVLTDPDLSYASGANFSVIKNWGANLQFDYELSEDLSLKSITAYRKLDSRFGADIGGAPFAALVPTFHDDESQFSQELQLNGAVMDDRWKFVLGGYYFHESGINQNGVPFTGGLIQVNAPHEDYDTKSYSAFMHNNIDIIPDKLGLTVGLRYTSEKKTFTGTQRDENAFFVRLLQLPPAASPDRNDIYRLYPVGENKQSFDNFSYRLGAEYHVTDDVMVYASYATAFKGGGWTTRLSAPNFTVGATGITPDPAPTFGPEKAGTAEIGVKSTLFDRRLRVNIAAFKTDYKDIQLTFQNGISPVTANGGDGEIKGVEVEVNTAFSRHVILDANLGYLDAEYTKVLPGVALTGNERFVNTPKLMTRVGVGYLFETPVGAITPRLEWTYASKSYNDEANTPDLVTPSHSFLTSTVNWRLPNDHLQLTMGVSNLTDKRIIMSGYTNAQAIYSGIYSRPREWFLTLRYEY